MKMKMKELSYFLVFICIVTLQFMEATMVQAQDSANNEKDPEVQAKQKEADIAEAEARIYESQKKIAEAKKAIEKATNVELTEAEIEKDKAEADKAIAEAQKTEFMAQIPEPKTQPLAGNVALDEKAGYFVEILAYETVRDNAEKIAQSLADKIKQSSTKKILLVKNPDYLKRGLLLKEIEKRILIFDTTLDALLARYQVIGGIFTIKEAPGLLALSAIPAVLGTLADVAALFRVDRDVKGRATNVDDEALIVEIARNLSANKDTSDVEIIRTSLNAQPAPPILSELQETGEKANRASLRLAEIRAVLTQVEAKIVSTEAKIAVVKEELGALTKHFAEMRGAITGEISRLKGLHDKTPVDAEGERERLKREIKEEEAKLEAVANEEKREQKLRDQIKADVGSLEGPRHQKAQVALVIPQFEGVITAFSEFRSKLFTHPDGSNSSPLEDLAEVSLLQDKPDDVLILTASVEGQGGEVETRKSIWTSGRIYHRAGSACSYVLFNSQGKIIASGLTVSDRQMKEGKYIR